MQDTLPAIKFDPAIHNGIITIENRASGDYRTFRIRTQPKDSNFKPGERIVALLSGPDNTSDYLQFGTVRPDGTIKIWQRFAGSPTFQAYGRLLSDPDGYSNVRTAIAPQGYKYLCEGKCRVCNRPLSTPESIETGIGPICGGKQ